MASAVVFWGALCLVCTATTTGFQQHVQPHHLRRRAPLSAKAGKKKKKTGAPTPVVPELSRPMDVSKVLNRGGRVEETIVADTAEMAAIAARIDVGQIDAFGGTFVAFRDGDDDKLEGDLEATVTQRCIVTGKPVPDVVTARFRVTLREGGDALDAYLNQKLDKEFLADVDFDQLLADVGDDLDLDEETLDITDQDDVVNIAADGSVSVDVGELAVQYLALKVNPYPRHASADDFRVGQHQGDDLSPVGSITVGKDDYDAQ